MNKLYFRKIYRENTQYSDISIFSNFCKYNFFFVRIIFLGNLDKTIIEINDKT